MAESLSQVEFAYQVQQVRQAVAASLGPTHTQAQTALLQRLAATVEAARDDILEANTLDLEASLEMAVPDLVLDWLKLTPERLLTAVTILKRLAALGHPQSWLAAGGCSLVSGGFSQGVPLGVVALMYEAFPELAIVAAGLCVRTGNGLVLKGGNEASQTNQAIAHALQRALEAEGHAPACVLNLSADQGDATRTWLMQEPGINLLIPYGRPNLVNQVARQAAVPVLPTTMGNCYLYWAASASPQQVAEIVVDSHRGDPDVVNRVEKVLISPDCGPRAWQELGDRLQQAGLELHVDADLAADFPGQPILAAEGWQRPFLRRRVALKPVATIAAAAQFINHHSSGHADVLVTASHAEVIQFTQQVTSNSLYINRSPRFLRNPASATDIALGMTAQKGHAGGIVGLQALLTTQHVRQG